MRRVYRTVAASALLATIVQTAGAATAWSKPTDPLGLKNSQEHAIYRDLGREATVQRMPTGFKAQVGPTVPGDLQVYSMPADVVQKVGAVKPYDYVLLSKRYDYFFRQKQVLLVDPSNKKIVDVINP